MSSMPPPPHEPEPPYTPPSYGHPTYGEPTYSPSYADAGPIASPEPTVPFTPLPPLPSSAPKKKNKTMLYAIIGIAAVAVVAVVAVVALGGDDGDKALSTQNAKRSILAITDNADLGRDVRRVTLDECPFDGIDKLADKAPSDFDAGDAAKGDGFAFVIQSPERDDPQIIQCVQAADDLKSTFGVTVGEAPPVDVEEFLKRDLPDFTIKTEDTEKFRGGTIQPFCATPKAKDDGSLKFCEAIWFDSQIQIGLFGAGGDADPDVSSEWLKAVLPDLLTSVEKGSPDGKISDPEGFPIDPAPLAAKREDMLKAAKVLPGPETFTLEKCPFVDLKKTASLVPKGFDAAAAVGGGITATASSDGFASSKEFVECFAQNADGSVAFGIFIAKPPAGDFNKAIAADIDVDTKFADPIDFLGGTIISYCAVDGETVNFCRADWVSGEMRIALFLSGDGASAELAAQWQQASLADTVASILKAKATDVVVSAE